MRTCGLSICITLAVVIGVDGTASAQNSKQRRELSLIRRDLNKVPGLVRRKKVKEAQAIIKQAEERLDKVVKEAKLRPNHRTVAGLKRFIQYQKQIILKAQGNNPNVAGISFEKQVAPILKASCARCHGANRPRGGLRLDTVAGIAKGGGSLIAAGNPQKSELFTRLISQDRNQRMPKGGQLNRTQIQIIGLWIKQGAKFDGASAKIAKKSGTPVNKKPIVVKVPKPTGDETVSFTKDIAPFMVNLCLNCHNDRRKRGGFSMETFEKLLIGGKSGRVVLPGNLDGSRMWDLAGKQKPIKMPAGQARITRTNWRNLRTWIQEGAKFDGKDPKASLRSLVPTEEELKAARFAKMSAEQFAQYRRKRMEDVWGRVLPKEKPQQVETKEFFLIGNVSKARLETIGKWAESQAERLRKTFRDKSSLLFKGKLAIVVMKDRFSYAEFNLIVQRREIPKAMTGHSVVDKLYEDAYIVVQDLGDSPGSNNPGMQVNVIEHLSTAFVKRAGDKLPEWLRRGVGLALAAQAEPKNAYFDGLRDRVPAILKTVQKPDALFANGTFSPADVGPVGYTLVDYMLRAGGGAKFNQFVTSLQRGNSVKGALQSVYKTTPAQLARGYAAGVGKKRRSRK